MILKVNCRRCKKEFFVYPSDIKEGKGKHCSRKCQFETQRLYPNRGCFQKGHKQVGGFVKGCKHSKEARIKIGIANKNRINGFLGKKHTEEARKKMRESHLGYAPWNKGKTHMRGEKHPNWRGGITLEEYGKGFDNPLREQVRFRDKYKCRVCECSQLENGKQLNIHHIDYNKKNNQINNLISLCTSCHCKTQWNRNYWKDLIENLIYQ